MGKVVFKIKMMKIKVFICILFTGSLLLHACKKDVDVFVPDPGQMNGPDTTWQNTITAAMPVSVLKNNLAQEPVYVDSINVNASIASVTTPFGIQVNFPPNCCATAAGQPVTGRVQVELKVIKKKGDMIRLNKPSTHQPIAPGRQQPGAGRMECADKIKMVSLGKILWHLYRKNNR